MACAWELVAIGGGPASASGTRALLQLVKAVERGRHLSSPGVISNLGRSRNKPSVPERQILDRAEILGSKSTQEVPRGRATRQTLGTP
jgi:hypothetical protein